MTKFNHLIKKARDFIHVVPGRFKCFTFIINRGQILSFGYCQSFKTHPLSNKYGYRFSDIHSELHAIQRFPFRPAELANCTLVNVRLGLDGSVRMSKPCPICQKLLADFNITNVYYTNRDGNFVAL